MLAGDDANASELTFDAHTGTHVDAPRHFVPWKNQHGMETVDIGAMNGPALLIEAYDVPVLNEEALEALDIRTRGIESSSSAPDNTRRKLMHTGIHPGPRGLRHGGQVFRWSTGRTSER